MLKLGVKGQWRMEWGGGTLSSSQTTLSQLKFGGEAQTIGHRSDMSSLRVEHGGELGIMLLIYTMQIWYAPMQLPQELQLYVDNSEVVRRDQNKIPTLGIKQQLALDYDLWATTQRLQEVLVRKIQLGMDKGTPDSGQWGQVEDWCWTQ